MYYHVPAPAFASLINHALPLVLRTPTQCLVHAREDHERCLRLAASYRLRLARGETEMRELHAWALGHARILRRRFLNLFPIR